MPTSSQAERRQIQALATQLFPACSVTRLESLHGGLSARMQVVHVVSAGGTRERFVLRRNLPTFMMGSPARSEREYRTLQLLQETGVRAPAPLWLDADGRHFGTPAMALSFLVGRSVLQPQRRDRWLHGMASALASVHTISPGSHDLSFLEDTSARSMDDNVDRTLDADQANGPMVQKIAEVLRRAAAGLEPSQPCLVHGDFWPAHVLFNRGGTAGVIDWSFAALGDPREDVSQCRLDLALMYGEPVAREFLDAYEALSPEPLQDIWFFDLLRSLGAMGSLGNYQRWLKGYHDLGLTNVTRDLAHERLYAFVGSAMAAAGLR